MDISEALLEEGVLNLNLIRFPGGWTLYAQHGTLLIEQHQTNDLWVDLPTPYDPEDDHSFSELINGRECLDDIDLVHEPIIGDETPDQSDA